MKESILCYKPHHCQPPGTTETLPHQAPSTMAGELTVCAMWIVKGGSRRIKNSSNNLFINFNNSLNTHKFKLICWKGLKWMSIKKINSLSSYKDKIIYLKIKSFKWKWPMPSKNNNSKRIKISNHTYKISPGSILQAPTETTS